MSLQLVILDCDGVLVDSEPIASRIVSESLTASGWPVSAEKVHASFVGGTMGGVLKTARANGAVLPDDWVEQTYRALFATLADEVEEVPGATAALDALDAAGIAYCVASNGPRRKMEITLGRTGLLSRLQDVIFSAHEVGSAKPDPGLHLHAASAMGVDPAHCVVIDDSVSGVKGAVNAGIRVLGFAVFGQDDALREAGAEVFDDMAALPKVLGLAS